LFPFWLSFFSPFILLLCFLDFFADLLFVFSIFFLYLSRFFSNLLILRISYGLVNITQLSKWAVAKWTMERFYWTSRPQILFCLQRINL
jgi:hypothetical protein